MKTILLYFIFFSTIIFAQDGSPDTSFNIGSGANGNVYLIRQLSDGKILIGGQFTTYNGAPANQLARLNSNGTLDTTFSSGLGISGLLISDAIEDNGKIIIVGEFGSYHGIPRNSIARLNMDGSLDNSFDPGSGAMNIEKILKQDDKFLVTGLFQTYDGNNSRSIARINSDGSFDETFLALGTEPSFNVAISDAIIQPDGKIFVVGNFSTINGVVRNKVARLNADGSLDLTFDPHLGPSSDILSACMQADGKYVISGLFSQFDGNPANLIARINPDGSYDSSFVPGAGYGIAATTLLIQPDQKIISGGWLTTAGGNGKYLLRLLSNGSVDDTFNPDAMGPDNTINTLSFQSDGKILAGGWFTSINGTDQNRITRLNNNISLSTVDFSTEYRIYPNPVKDILVVEQSNFSAAELEIADATGKILIATSINSSLHSIDMSSFSAGIYIIKLKMGTHASNMKIIKL
jgi:uncharacterized delta-60 repeat protein